MKILIACEESQRICIEFRKLGHEAYSCDIIDPSGGHPEWHIKGDALELLNPPLFFCTMDGQNHEIQSWDLIIAHPPCTYLSTVATRHHSLKTSTLEKINARTLKRIAAQEFFMAFVMADCPKIAVENPVGVMNTVYRKPDQIIDPYNFAESINDTENYVTKKTCLWLKGLPPLEINDLPKPNNKEKYGVNPNGKIRCWCEMVSKDRSRERSKTFPGVAKAIAEQWSNI